MESGKSSLNNLLNILDGYASIYNSLDTALQDEWDKVEAEAIGALVDPTLKIEVVETNLRTFLDKLKTVTTNGSN